MSRFLRQLWNGPSHFRRSLSAAILAVYVMTATGMPLPLGGRPHSDELYPCSNCACGCATAEQCWRSCCCHTLAERFAWAREHGVIPPDYAIAQAQAAGLNLAWLGSPKLLPPCCAAKATCCQQKAKTCCSKSSPSCCAQHSTAEGATKTSKSGHIVAWRALACHGQSMNWLAAVPTLIVVRPEVSHESPIVVWLGPATSDSAAPGFSSPEVPPPEIA